MKSELTDEFIQYFSTLPEGVKETAQKTINSGNKIHFIPA